MKNKQVLSDFVFTAVVIIVAYFASLMAEDVFHTRTLVPMIFVMGVFLIALKTQGYFWGMSASLASVLSVNYTFTYPYDAIDLITFENMVSAVVILVVSAVTSTLTTKLKAQEKLNLETEKERMRANLLRAISHDLRTPLTSIYGCSSTVLENYDVLTREQKMKLMVEVRDDAQWLIRMVENLLSITRIDGGNARINKQPVVLEELIDDVLLKFRKQNPDIPLALEIPEDFIVIPMDVMLIQQVMVNLLGNAVDHALGMTELRLEVKQVSNKVFFSVQDNGCGIPPEHMKNLFSGYHAQTEMPTDSGRHNMGIGLSVCDAIVKAHGGEIHAKNNPEGGASFTFWLELEENYEQQ